VSVSNRREPRSLDVLRDVPLRRQLIEAEQHRPQIGERFRIVWRSSNTAGI